MKATAVSLLLFHLTFLSTPSDAATFATDKPDYQPGDVVIITGTGWQPGRVVQLYLEETPEVVPADHTWTVTAYADGRLIITVGSKPIPPENGTIQFTLNRSTKTSTSPILPDLPDCLFSVAVDHPDLPFHFM